MHLERRGAKVRGVVACTLSTGVVGRKGSVKKVRGVSHMVSPAEAGKSLWLLSV